MTPKWHRFIETLAPEHAGIIFNAMQRYLQFDTFAGAIPPEAIDTLFSDARLQRIAQQAVNFCNKYRDQLTPMQQNVREEAVRAHLAGIINLPVPSQDNWHDSFRQLHARNREHYDKLGTAARVELLMKEHPDTDIIASAVSKYQADGALSYTPMELIGWVLQATGFYLTNRERLQRYSAKEQRAILSKHLAGKSDIAW